MVNAIPYEVLMPSTKYAGLSYHTHFLKSRGSVIRNNFFSYRTNKTTHFARRNDCYALLAINKANHILNSKSIKNNRKKSRFGKFTISLLVIIFSM